MTRVLVVATIGAVLGMLAAPRGSRAGELEKRLPQNGNAILTIDVAKLLDSPLAKAEGWQSKMISGYADRPLAVPGTAKRVAMTAFIHPANLAAIWQASVIELPGDPPLAKILQTQRGYPDTIGSMKAAWTPRDVYYVQLDDHTLGMLRPGDRQALARWTSGKMTQTLSPYLASAINAASDAPVVLAIDLNNSVGTGAVAYAFAAGKLPSLEKLENGREKLLSALGSVKGLTMRTVAEKQFDSEMTVDFDQPVDALGANAKAFVVDVLNACGLADPQLDKWDFKASGRTITGKGESDAGALGRLIAVMSPGDLGAIAADPQQAAKSDGGGAAPAADTSTPASPAAASQAYYRAISKMLDQAAAKASPTHSATWLHAQARQIQQLPILGVDPDLLAWGDQITEAFNRAAQTLAVGQQNAQVAAEGVASPTGSSYDSYGSQGGSNMDSPESRAAFRNAQQQRRQAAQGQRAASADQALTILNDAASTRGKIRQAMVQKYNVEF